MTTAPEFTPQAITSVLVAAGFKPHGAVAWPPGFKISPGDENGSLIIRAGPEPHTSDRARERETQMLDGCATALENAGYQVTRGGDWLVVTAGEG